MSDEEQKPAPVPEETPAEREMKMFRDWCMGKTMTGICQQYGISVTQLSLIAKKGGWKEHKRKLEALRYKAAMDSLKQQARDLIHLVGDDVKRLFDDVKKSKRQLTKDERMFAKAMLEQLFKENRLSDGQPTAIVDGTHVQEIHLKLPAGVKEEDFAIIPPDPKVKFVDSTVEPEKEAPADLDQIADELDSSDKT